jgi:VWFA-related protein
MGKGTFAMNHLCFYQGRFSRREGRALAALAASACMVATIIMLTLGTPLATNQQSRETDQEATDERFIHVTFRRDNGHPVRSLRPEEIQILAGGELQQITRVVQPEEPFNIGLLIDVSPSKDAEVGTLRSGTAWFVEQFPEPNPIMILTFDSEIYLDCDWTTDRKRVDEAIWEFGLHKPGSKTILHEAIVAAVDQKFIERKPRTAMILFSDGVDVGSQSEFEDESIKVLKRSGVLTYCIQHFSMAHHWQVHYPNPDPNDIQSMPPVPGTNTGPIFIGRTERDQAEYKINRIHSRAVEYLGKAAQAGGGRHIQLASASELQKAYDRVASELLDTYTIFFVPSGRSNPGEFRRVRVVTTREGVVGYPRPEGYWVDR